MHPYTHYSPLHTVHPYTLYTPTHCAPLHTLCTPTHYSPLHIMHPYSYTLCTPIPTHTVHPADIEAIEVRFDEGDTEMKARKVYNYRVVMIKQNGIELDMRGRCSTGQKVREAGGHGIGERESNRVV